MTTAPLTHHGGNLAAARAAFPDAPEPWIDLSTGINPVAYPVGEIPPAAWSRLPEPADVAALEAAAARTYGAGPDVAVVAAPGTQALIQLLPGLIDGPSVAVLGPTYGEHAASWIAAGRSVRIVNRADDVREGEIAVVVNPNNPDGRLLDAAALAALAGRVAALVVDEAFMDVMPDGTGLLPAGLPPRALVLRSFGKTYGLAGLRLGFLAAGHDMADAARTALGPWAVSGPAIDVGRRALADVAWLAAARRRLAADADRLDALLARAGLAVTGGTPLFRFARSPAAPRWFERLARAGILVRPFADRPDRLRFGLPAGEAAWRRLAAALGET